MRSRRPPAPPIPKESRYTPRDELSRGNINDLKKKALADKQRQGPSTVRKSTSLPPNRPRTLRKLLPPLPTMTPATTSSIPRNTKHFPQAPMQNSRLSMTFVPGAGSTSLSHIRPSQMRSTLQRRDSGYLPDRRETEPPSATRTTSNRDRQSIRTSIRSSTESVADKAVRHGFSSQPKYTPVDPQASIAMVLQPSALPRGCKPESVDLGFKAHMALISRMTIGGFDKVMRYLFLYKPLAKAYAVLVPVLMGVPTIDSGRGALSSESRNLVFYAAANQLGSVYGMAYAARSKSVFSNGKSSTDKHTDKITFERELTDKDELSIKFAREICATPTKVTEEAREKISRWSLLSRGRAEKEIAGVSGTCAFFAKMYGALDIEMDYVSFKYCTTHLGQLGWNAGSHLKISSIEEDMFEESNNIAQSAKPQTKRISRFFHSSLSAAKNVREVKRESEEWMKKANMPPRGKDSEPAMREIIEMLFGFQPFYLSKQAHVNEDSRRAFIFAAKELLFYENELTRSLKFMVCYVVTRCEQRRTDNETSEGSGSEENQNRPRTPSGAEEGVDIVAAHAAYLAHRYGAGRDALEVCTNREYLRRSMKKYLADEKRGRSTHSCPLTKKECAALLMAHSLAMSPPELTKEEVEYMIAGFGNPSKRRQRGGRSCHQAILEVIGAVSYWALIQRYSAATQAFDMKGDRSGFYGISDDPAREFVEGPIGRQLKIRYIKDITARDEGRFAHPQRSFTTPERHSFARFRERTKSFSSLKMPSLFRRGLSIS